MLLNKYYAYLCVMIKFTFFRARQPRTYDYYPRYYDPQKEDLEKRIAQAKAEANRVKSDAEIERELKFKKEVSSGWKNTTAKQQIMKSNIRLVLILIGVCLLFYYIYGKIDVFLENLIN